MALTSDSLLPIAENISLHAAMQSLASEGWERPTILASLVPVFIMSVRQFDAWISFQSGRHLARMCLYSIAMYCRFSRTICWNFYKRFRRYLRALSKGLSLTLRFSSGLFIRSASCTSIVPLLLSPRGKTNLMEVLDLPSLVWLRSLESRVIPKPLRSPSKNFLSEKSFSFIFLSLPRRPSGYSSLGVKWRRALTERQRSENTYCRKFSLLRSSSLYCSLREQISSEGYSILLLQAKDRVFSRTFVILRRTPFCRLAWFKTHEKYRVDSAARLCSQLLRSAAVSRFSGSRSPFRCTGLEYTKLTLTSFFLRAGRTLQQLRIRGRLRPSILWPDCLLARVGANSLAEDSLARLGANNSDSSFSSVNTLGYVYRCNQIEFLLTAAGVFYYLTHSACYFAVIFLALSSTFAEEYHSELSVSGSKAFFCDLAIAIQLTVSLSSIPLQTSSYSLQSALKFVAKVRQLQWWLAVKKSQAFDFEPVFERDCFLFQSRSNSPLTLRQSLTFQRARVSKFWSTCLMSLYCTNCRAAAEFATWVWASAICLVWSTFRLLAKRILRSRNRLANITASESTTILNLSSESQGESRQSARNRSQSTVPILSIASVYQAIHETDHSQPKAASGTPAMKSTVSCPSQLTCYQGTHYPSHSFPPSSTFSSTPSLPARIVHLHPEASRHSASPPNRTLRSRYSVSSKLPYSFTFRLTATIEPAVCIAVRLSPDTNLNQSQPLTVRISLQRLNEKEVLPRALTSRGISAMLALNIFPGTAGDGILSAKSSILKASKNSVKLFILQTGVCRSRPRRLGATLSALAKTRRKLTWGQRYERVQSRAVSVEMSERFTTAKSYSPWLWSLSLIPGRSRNHCTPSIGCKLSPSPGLSPRREGSNLGLTESRQLRKWSALRNRRDLPQARRKSTSQECQTWRRRLRIDFLGRMIQSRSPVTTACARSQEPRILLLTSMKKQASPLAPPPALFPINLQSRLRLLQNIKTPIQIRSRSTKKVTAQHPRDHLPVASQTPLLARLRLLLCTLLPLAQAASLASGL